jgi:hypothetical protein
MKQAERQLVSRGDLVGAAEMASRRMWAERMGGGGGFSPRPVPGGIPPAAPMPMSMPTGTDADGFQMPLTPQGASARAPMTMPDLPPDMPPLPPRTIMGMNPLGLMPSTAPNVPAGFGEMTQRQAFDPNSFPGLPMPPPGLYQESPGYKVTEAGGMNILEGPDGKFRGFTKADAPPMPGWMNQPGTNLLMPTLGGQPNPTLGMFQFTPKTVESPLAPGQMGPGAPKTVAKITPVEKPAKAPTLKQIYEGDVPQNVQWNEQRNRWERVNIYNPGDPDDNGIPGDQRSGPGAGGVAPSSFLNRFKS